MIPLHKYYIGAWIPGYEGCYSITTGGEVFSYYGVYPKVLKAHYDPVVGYMFVVLRRPGKEKRYTSLRIHRALAAVFIGDCPKGYCVSHKDSNKLNNNLSNLEYITYKENTRISREKGDHGRKCGNLSKDSVSLLVRLKQEGVHTNTEIASRVGCSVRSVQRVYSQYRHQTPN